MFFLSQRKMILRGLLSLILFFNHTLLAHSLETNLWEQRKKARQLASLPLPHPPFAHPQKRAFPLSIPKIAPPKTASLHDRVINFPHHLGRVRKIQSSQSKKTLIHIQDIHENFEAQQNISKILHTLAQDSGLNAIGLEASFDPINFSSFHNNETQENLKDVADHLLESLQIPGSVHFGLLQKNPSIKFFGVDDLNLYNANVEAFLNSRPQKPQVLDKLSIENRLNLEDIQILNPKLQEFHLNVKNYYDKSLTLGEFVLRVEKISNNLPKSLRRFITALKIERSLDFAKVQKDRDTLITKLASKLNSAQQANLIRKTLEFRSGQLSQKLFHDHLFDIAKTKGISPDSYPHFSQYLTYISLSDSLNAEIILNDLDNSISNIYSQLIKTSDEKRIVDQTLKIHLTSKLVHFELNSKEWAAYKNLRGLFNVDSFENFYETAEKRDQAFSKNIIDQFNIEEKKTMVVIAGGFHSEGLYKYLQDSSINIYSITPRITKIDLRSGSSYLNSFAQEKSPLEKLALGKKLFLAKQGWTTPLILLTGSLLGIKKLWHTNGKISNPDLETHIEKLTEIDVPKVKGSASSPNYSVTYGGKVTSNAELTPEGKFIRTWVSDKSNQEKVLSASIGSMALFLLGADGTLNDWWFAIGSVVILGSIFGLAVILLRRYFLGKKHQEKLDSPTSEPSYDPSWNESNEFTYHSEQAIQNKDYVISYREHEGAYYYLKTLKESGKDLNKVLIVNVDPHDDMLDHNGYMTPGSWGRHAIHEGLAQGYVLFQLQGPGKKPRIYIYTKPIDESGYKPIEIQEDQYIHLLQSNDVFLTIDADAYSLGSKDMTSWVIPDAPYHYEENQWDDRTKQINTYFEQADKKPFAVVLAESPTFLDEKAYHTYPTWFDKWQKFMERKYTPWKGQNILNLSLLPGFLYRQTAHMTDEKTREILKKAIAYLIGPIIESIFIFLLFLVWENFMAIPITNIFQMVLSSALFAVLSSIIFAFSHGSIVFEGRSAQPVPITSKHFLSLLIQGYVYSLILAFAAHGVNIISLENLTPLLNLFITSGIPVLAGTTPHTIHNRKVFVKNEGILGMTTSTLSIFGLGQKFRKKDHPTFPWEINDEDRMRLSIRNLRLDPLLIWAFLEKNNPDKLVDLVKHLALSKRLQYSDSPIINTETISQLIDGVTDHELKVLKKEDFETVKLIGTGITLKDFFHYFDRVNPTENPTELYLFELMQEYGQYRGPRLQRDWKHFRLNKQEKEALTKKNIHWNKLKRDEFKSYLFVLLAQQISNPKHPQHDPNVKSVSDLQPDIHVKNIPVKIGGHELKLWGLFQTELKKGPNGKSPEGKDGMRFVLEQLRLVDFVPSLQFSRPGDRVYSFQDYVNQGFFARFNDGTENRIVFSWNLVPIKTQAYLVRQMLREVMNPNSTYYDPNVISAHDLQDEHFEDTFVTISGKRIGFQKILTYYSNNKKRPFYDQRPPDKTARWFMLERLGFINPRPGLRSIKSYQGPNGLKNYIEDGYISKRKDTGDLIIPWRFFYREPELIKEMVDATAVQFYGNGQSNDQLLASGKMTEAALSISETDFNRPLVGILPPNSTSESNAQSLSSFKLSHDSDLHLRGTLTRWHLLEVSGYLDPNLPRLWNLHNGQPFIQTGQDLRKLKEQKAIPGDTPWLTIVRENPEFVQQLLKELSATKKLINDGRVLNPDNEQDRRDVEVFSNSIDLSEIKKLSYRDYNEITLPTFGTTLSGLYQSVQDRTPKNESTIPFLLESVHLVQSHGRLKEAFSLKTIDALSKSGVLSDKSKKWDKGEGIPPEGQRALIHRLAVLSEKNQNNSVDDLISTDFQKSKKGDIPELNSALSALYQETLRNHSKDKDRSIHEMLLKNAGFVRDKNQLLTTLKNAAKGLQSYEDVLTSKKARKGNSAYNFFRTQEKVFHKLKSFNPIFPDQYRDILDEALTNAFFYRRLLETTNSDPEEIKRLDDWILFLRSFWSLHDSFVWTPETLQKIIDDAAHQSSGPYASRTGVFSKLKYGFIVVKLASNDNVLPIESSVTNGDGSESSNYDKLLEEANSLSDQEAYEAIQKMVSLRSYQSENDAWTKINQWNIHRPVEFITTLDRFIQSSNRQEQETAYKFTLISPWQNLWRELKRDLPDDIAKDFEERTLRVGQILNPAGLGHLGLSFLPGILYRMAENIKNETVREYAKKFIAVIFGPALETLLIVALHYVWRKYIFVSFHSIDGLFFSMVLFSIIGTTLFTVIHGKWVFKGNSTTPQPITWDTFKNLWWQGFLYSIVYSFFRDYTEFIINPSLQIIETSNSTRSIIAAWLSFFSHASHNNYVYEFKHGVMGITGAKKKKPQGSVQVPEKERAAFHRSRIFWTEVGTRTKAKLVREVFKKVTDKNSKYYDPTVRRPLDLIKNDHFKNVRLRVGNVHFTLEKLFDYELKTRLKSGKKIKPDDKDIVWFILEEYGIIPKKPGARSIKSLYGKKGLFAYINQGHFLIRKKGEWNLNIPWSMVDVKVHRQLIEELAARTNNTSVATLKKKKKLDQAIRDLSDPGDYRERQLDNLIRLPAQKRRQKRWATAMGLFQHYKKKSRGTLKSARWTLLETIGVIPTDLKTPDQLRYGQELKRLLDLGIYRDDIPWRIIIENNPRFMVRILKESFATRQLLVENPKLTMRTVDLDDIQNRAASIPDDYITPDSIDFDSYVPTIGIYLTGLRDHLYANNARAERIKPLLIELAFQRTSVRRLSQAYTLNGIDELRQRKVIGQERGHGDIWDVIPKAGKRALMNKTAQIRSLNGEPNRFSGLNGTILKGTKIPELGSSLKGLAGHLRNHIYNKNDDGTRFSWQVRIDQILNYLGFVQSEEKLFENLKSIQDGFEIQLKESHKWRPRKTDQLHKFFKNEALFIKELQTITSIAVPSEYEKVRSILDRALIRATNLYQEFEKNPKRDNRKRKRKKLKTWIRGLEAAWELLDSKEWISHQFNLIILMAENDQNFLKIKKSLSKYEGANSILSMVSPMDVRVITSESFSQEEITAMDKMDDDQISQSGFTIEQRTKPQLSRSDILELAELYLQQGQSTKSHGPWNQLVQSASQHPELFVEELNVLLTTPGPARKRMLEFMKKLPKEAMRSLLLNVRADVSRESFKSVETAITIAQSQISGDFKFSLDANWENIPSGLSFLPGIFYQRAEKIKDENLRKFTKELIIGGLGPSFETILIGLFHWVWQQHMFVNPTLIPTLVISSISFSIVSATLFALLHGRHVFIGNSTIPQPMTRAYFFNLWFQGFIYSLSYAFLWSYIQYRPVSMFGAYQYLVWLPNLFPFVFSFLLHTEHNLQVYTSGSGVLGMITARSETEQIPGPVFEIDWETYKLDLEQAELIRQPKINWNSLTEETQAFMVWTLFETVTNPNSSNRFDPQTGTDNHDPSVKRFLDLTKKHFRDVSFEVAGTRMTLSHMRDKYMRNRSRPPNNQRPADKNAIWYLLEQVRLIPWKPGLNQINKIKGQNGLQEYIDEGYFGSRSKTTGDLSIPWEHINGKLLRRLVIELAARLNDMSSTRLRREKDLTEEVLKISDTEWDTKLVGVLQIQDSSDDSAIGLGGLLNNFTKRARKEVKTGRWLILEKAGFISKKYKSLHHLRKGQQLKELIDNKVLIEHIPWERLEENNPKFLIRLLKEIIATKRIRTNQPDLDPEEIDPKEVETLANTIRIKDLETELEPSDFVEFLPTLESNLLRFYNHFALRSGLPPHEPVVPWILEKLTNKPSERRLSEAFSLEAINYLRNRRIIIPKLQFIWSILPRSGQRALVARLSNLKSKPVTQLITDDYDDFQDGFIPEFGTALGGMLDHYTSSMNDLYQNLEKPAGMIGPRFLLDQINFIRDPGQFSKHIRQIGFGLKVFENIAIKQKVEGSDPVKMLFIEHRDIYDSLSRTEGVLRRSEIKKIRKRMDQALLQSTRLLQKFKEGPKEDDPKGHLVYRLEIWILTLNNYWDLLDTWDWTRDRFAEAVREARNYRDFPSLIEELEKHKAASALLGFIDKSLNQPKRSTVSSRKSGFSTFEAMLLILGQFQIFLVTLFLANYFANVQLDTQGVGKLLIFTTSFMFGAALSKSISKRFIKDNLLKRTSTHVKNLVNDGESLNQNIGASMTNHPASQHRKTTKISDEEIEKSLNLINDLLEQARKEGSSSVNQNKVSESVSRALIYSRKSQQKRRFLAPFRRRFLYQS